MFKPQPPPLLAVPGPPETYELEMTAINPMARTELMALQGGATNTMDMSDPEHTLYKGYWRKTGICCCQGTSSAVAESAEEGELTNTNSDSGTRDTSLFDKNDIEITDSDIIYTTRVRLLPCVCCFGGCMQINTKTSALDGLTNLVVTEDKGQPACCGMVLM